MYIRVVFWIKTTILKSPFKENNLSDYLHKVDGGDWAHDEPAHQGSDRHVVHLGRADHNILQYKVHGSNTLARVSSWALLTIYSKVDNILYSCKQLTYPNTFIF